MIGAGRDDGKTKGEYSAILYRRERFEVEQGGTFWLSDTPEVPGSITWGNACTRICTWARFVERKTGRDNANVENPVPMVDTFRVLHPDANDVGTFNAFKGDKTGDKIDFILTTSDVQALDAQIIRDNINGRYPSDHFPITARLRFPAGTTR